MNEKIIKCKNCGDEILDDEVLCLACLNAEEEKYDYLSKNHSNYNYVVKKVETDIEEINEEEVNHEENIVLEGYSKVFPIRRFFLLMFFTCGLFEYYWFYKNSKLVFKELGQNSDAYLRTILFIIPILNIFAYYFYLDDIKKLLSENNLNTISPIGNLLLYIFFPILGIWSLFNVQEHLNEYWRLKEPNHYVKLNFSNNEIIAMAIIPLFFILMFLLSILSLTVILL